MAFKRAFFVDKIGQAVFVQCAFDGERIRRNVGNEQRKITIAKGGIFLHRSLDLHGDIFRFPHFIFRFKNTYFVRFHADLSRRFGIKKASSERFRFAVKGLAKG